MEKKGMSVQRHIIEQERQFPQATGSLTGLLMDLIYVAKIISREVNKAGLVDILGLTGFGTWGPSLHNGVRRAG